MDTVRIAVRNNATPLSREEIGQVSGGYPRQDAGTTGQGPFHCDVPTDCWVTGGDFVYNDD